MHCKNVFILLALVFFIAAAAIASAGCQKREFSVVTIDGGQIRGTLVDGVWTYLGVPFAEPPVGNLRWKEPQPVQAWQDIRQCNKYAPACPQPSTALYDIGPTSEDCLYLNVWTPAKSPDESLPVMFWIHGGGFTTGAASLPMYDGKNLAKQNVVIVSANYRLGPLGFLSHPLLSRESAHGVSGNYGLLDQIAALKWVKKNIEAFGGNPDLVTVWGESAGATSVIDLMASPLADGLFQRAISESGSFSDAYSLNRDDTVEKAERTGQEVAARLGLDKAADVLAAMRQVSADRLVEAAFTDYDALGTVKYRPVADGWVLPAKPWSLYTDGRQAKVPLLIGTNANEGTIFVLPNIKVQMLSAQAYADYINSVYGDNGADVLAAFPAPDKSDVPAAFAQMFATMSFGAGVLHAADTTSANGSPVYMYRFTRIPDTPLKIFGAFHGLEIFYVFGILKAGRVDIPVSDTDKSLSQNMMKYWTNFASTGNPNGSGLPEWPLYSAAKGSYMELGERVSAATGLLQQYRAVIDKVSKTIKP